MFLDKELDELQAAKARLSVRCDLRRELISLEVQSTWAEFKRKLVSASMGITIGLGVSELVLGYLRRRKARA